MLCCAKQGPREGARPHCSIIYCNVTILDDYGKPDHVLHQRYNGTLKRVSVLVLYRILHQCCRTCTTGVQYRTINERLYMMPPGVSVSVSVSVSVVDINNMNPIGPPGEHMHTWQVSMLYCTCHYSTVQTIQVEAVGDEYVSGPGGGKTFFWCRTVLQHCAVFFGYSKLPFEGYVYGVPRRRRTLHSTV